MPQEEQVARGVTPQKLQRRSIAETLVERTFRIETNGTALVSTECPRAGLAGSHGPRGNAVSRLYAGWASGKFENIPMLLTLGELPINRVTEIRERTSEAAGVRKRIVHLGSVYAPDGSHGGGFIGSHPRPQQIGNGNCGDDQDEGHQHDSQIAEGQPGNGHAVTLQATGAFLDIR